VPGGRRPGRTSPYLIIRENVAIDGRQSTSNGQDDGLAADTEGRSRKADVDGLG